MDIEDMPISEKPKRHFLLPTIQIYKNGVKVKEIICPSEKILDNLVKYYIYEDVILSITILVAFTHSLITHLHTSKVDLFY